MRDKTERAQRYQGAHGLGTVTLLVAVALAACTPTATSAPPTLTPPPTDPPPATVTAPPTAVRPTVTQTLPAPTATATVASATATATEVVIAEAQPILFPAGAVRAYPYPPHYAGDTLTIEILLDDFAENPEGPVSLSFDGSPPVERPGDWQGNVLIVRDALDTQGVAAGDHELHLTAQNGTVTVDATYAFELVTPEAPPTAEAQWLVHELDCCVLHYISGTAAERDLETISAVFEQAALDLTERTSATLDTPLEIYLLDRMWGNGAYGGNGQLAVSYTDRYYGPGQGEVGLHTLALHEFTHATRIDQGPDGFFRWNEGLAVYVAGGHYKPEPLRERGAALYALGYYTGSPAYNYPRHEAAYLDGALRVLHIAEAFGTEALWQYVEAASGFEVLDDPDALNTVTRNILGISADELDSQFLSWVQAIPPGDQLDDLRLTLEVQAARRQYQDLYSPPPQSIFGLPAETVTSPWALQAALREPNTGGHVAVEVMIAAGQRAVIEGRYAEAQALVDALENTLATGAFGHPLAAEYLTLVNVLSEQGLVVDAINLMGDRATATAYRPEAASLPPLETINLVKIDGAWRIE